MKTVTREQVEDGKSYTIHGSDCYGDWDMPAVAKFYLPVSSKAQLNKRFRFLDLQGRVIPNHEIERIEEL